MNEQAQEMYNDLVQKVQQWSIDRNLHTADPTKQFLKVVEEFGEMMGADDLSDYKDGVGDTLVTCIILAQQTGVELHLTDSNYEIDTLQTAVVNLGLIAESLAKGKGVNQKALNAFYNQIINSDLVNNAYACLLTAYNEIKDRKGKMINGVFVKEEDL